MRIYIRDQNDAVLDVLDDTYYDLSIEDFLKGKATVLSFSMVKDEMSYELITTGKNLSFVYDNEEYWLTCMIVEQDEYYLSVTAWSIGLEYNNETIGPYKSPKAMTFVEYLNVIDFEKVLTIGINEVSDKKISYEWTGTDKKLARLYSLANVFDAEIAFVTRLNDDGSLKQIVINIYHEHDDSHQGVGNDRRNETFYFGEEIKTIKKTEDKTGLYTAITATGKDGLTIATIDREVKDENGLVLYKTVSKATADYPDVNKIYAVQARLQFPSTVKSNDRWTVNDAGETEYSSAEALYGYMISQLKENSIPKVTWEIEGNIKAKIGDTVRIADEGYKPTLYLEARVTGKVRKPDNLAEETTTFSNVKELQSQVDQSLLDRVNALIEQTKPYTLSLVSDNGVTFKNSEGKTTLSAIVYNGTQVITPDVKVRWYKDDVWVKTRYILTIEAKNINAKAVYKAIVIDTNGKERATQDVTVFNVDDGKGIKGKPVLSYAGSASIDTVPTTWQATIPNVPAGSYLWTREVTTYSDDTTSEVITPVLQGPKGDTGSILGENQWIGHKYSYPGATRIYPNFDHIQGLNPIVTQIFDDSTTFSFGDDYYIAHFQSNLYVNIDKHITTTVSHDDDLTIYCNDEVVVSKNTTIFTPYNITFNLKAGWNKIDVLLHELSGGDRVAFGTKLSSLVDHLSYIKGADGKDGKSITDSKQEWAASTSGTTAPTTWQTAIPTVSAGQYLWSRVTETWSDNTHTYRFTIGKIGENGRNAQMMFLSADKNTMMFNADNTAKFAQTATITAKYQNVSGTVAFTAKGIKANGTSETLTLTGSGDSRTITSAMFKTDWVMITVTATLAGLTDTLSIIKVNDGAQGIGGATGYFHSAWAMSPDGRTGFSTTVSEGKWYIGTYFDFVEADSTDPARYNWLELAGAVKMYNAYAWSPDGKDRFTRVKPIVNMLGNIGEYNNLTDKTRWVWSDSSTSAVTSSSYDSNTKMTTLNITGVGGYEIYSIPLDFTALKSGYLVIDFIFNRDLNSWVNSAKQYVSIVLSSSPLYGSKETGIFSTYQMSNIKAGKRTVVIPYTNIDNTAFLSMNLGYLADGSANAYQVKIGNIMAVTDASLAGSGFSPSFINDYDNAVPRYIGRSLKDSNNPSDYTWEPNPERKPWTAYAQGFNGEGFSLMPLQELAKYIGTAALPYTDYTKYVWNLNPAWLQQESNNNLANKVDNDTYNNDQSNVWQEISNRVTEEEAQAIQESLNKITGAYTDFVSTGGKHDKDLANLKSAINTDIQKLADKVLGFDFVNTWFRIGDGGLSIGEANSNFEILVSNDQITFYDSGTAVAYVSNQSFFINSGMIVDDLQIGKFKFAKVNDNLMGLFHIA